MKFKELPEGHYFVTGIIHSVYVEKVEAPEKLPRYVIDLETENVVHDGRNYRRDGRDLGDMEVEFKSYGEVGKIRKSIGARYGHIKRRILAKEPLKGKTLDLALELITPKVGDDLSNSIAKKLQAGQPLDDYESHIVVDVYLR